MLWASTIRDVGFNLFRHVIWGAHDAVTFDGFWDVNNCYDTEFKLWGSDSNYFTNGLLIDSPNTGTGNRYHVWAPWLGKTTFGPMFITGKANTTPMRIDGGRGIVVQAARFEAQQGNPTLGSQLLITGGTFVRIRDPWFFQRHVGGWLDRPQHSGVRQGNRHHHRRLEYRDRRRDVQRRRR
ncbi:hypothetical protein [Fodinicola feengrottensis]|uniref:hypothetical protein n=1 Tax=Fodinicola feengrottensis TaxID=435914 RepID=UPI0013D16730|nr:hypothetical protein [Fodinicola feengrottensis]